MLELIRTHVRKNYQWSPIDAANLTLDSLLNQYDDFKVYVKDSLQRERVITPVIIRETVNKNNYGYTLNGWLLTLTEDMGELNKHLTLDKVKSMSYLPIWDYPITTEMGNHNYGVGVDVPIGADRDLTIINSESDDYTSRWAEYGLITINGRVVRTKLIGERLFALNARRHILHYSDSPFQIGVMDFSEIGKLTWETISSEGSIYNTTVIDGNIVGLPAVANGSDEVVEPNTLDFTYIGQEADEDLAITDLVNPGISKITNVLVTADDNKHRRTQVVVKTFTDLSNKSVILILDGYPHILDDSIKVIDANTVLLNIDRKLVARRMLKDGYPFWPGADGVNVRNTGIDVDNLDIVEYLAAGTSAIVIVDNADLNIHKRVAGRTDIVGTYTYPYYPKGILQLENGDVADYIIDGENGLYVSMAIYGGLREVFMDESVDPNRRLTQSLTSRQTQKPEAMEAFHIDLYSTIEETA